MDYNIIQYNILESTMNGYNKIYNGIYYTII